MRVVFLAIVLSAFATIAQAATSLEQACKIKNAMGAKDTRKISDLVADLFKWNATMEAKRISSSFVVLDTLDFISADVFQGAKVGNYHDTLLVVAALEKNSPIFIELRFQQLNRQMRLTNVDFKDQLAKIYPNIDPSTELKQLTCS